MILLCHSIICVWIQLTVEPSLTSRSFHYRHTDSMNKKNNENNNTATNSPTLSIRWRETKDEKKKQQIKLILLIFYASFLLLFYLITSFPCPHSHPHIGRNEGCSLFMLEMDSIIFRLKTCKSFHQFDQSIKNVAEQALNILSIFFFFLCFFLIPLLFSFWIGISLNWWKLV